MTARVEPPPVTDGEVDGDEVDGDEIAGGAETQSVVRPTPATATSTIEASLGRGQILSLVGECTVEAEGGNGLPWGIRHVLLKPDGSVVLHGRDETDPDGAFQGEGGLDVTVIDDSLVVDASGDGETRRLRFGRIDLLASAAIDASDDAPVDDASENDGPNGSVTPEAESADDGVATTGDGIAGGEFDGSEIDGSDHDALLERLLSEPDLLEPGFHPLATERETPAGAVDLYGRDAEGRVVVVEIKAHRTGPAAVGQLDRYVSALRRDLHSGAEVRGVLVAPSATDRARRLLDERGFTFRALSLER